MRRLAALILSAAAVLALASPALAATPADKPVVTVGRLDVHDGGGASPDTWYRKVTVPVGGSNVTPAATSTSPSRI